MTDTGTPVEADQQKPWYQPGLRFTCTQCGRCCGGAPGYVWISEDEIEGLARHLRVDAATFRQTYTLTVAGQGVSLRERGARDNYQCVFYDSAGGCSVYAHRPAQCRTWPFWRSIIASEDSWKQHGRGCPGMDQGQWHSPDIIAATAAEDGIPDR